jgi:hypothetical protein
MRPSVTDVRQWFAAGALTDSLLASYLTILDDDPNWNVFDRSSGTGRALSLVYYPTGAHLDVVLERMAGGWRAPPVLNSDPASGRYVQGRETCTGQRHAGQRSRLLPPCSSCCGAT